MKKTVLKGLCQTLILMLALFLLAVQFVLSFSRMEEEVYLIEHPAEAADTMQEETGGAPAAEEAPSAGPEAAERESFGAKLSDDLFSQEGDLNSRIMSMLAGSPMLMAFCYAGLFLILALSSWLDYRYFAGDAKPRFFPLVYAGLFLACCALFLAAGASEAALIIGSAVYSLTLIAEAVLSIRANRRKRNIAFRAAAIALLLFNAAGLGYFAIVPVLALMVVRAFLQILKLSFSQIRVDILRKIIRKTYASEILIGMLLLILAFSFLLGLTEENIGGFGNALWYCFAIVTTIGFGDVTAVSLFGRILSVILGVYGIVVVALITSIIVNFYNEMKTETPADSPKDETAAGSTPQAALPEREKDGEI